MNVDYHNKSFNVEIDHNGRYVYSRPPVVIKYQCVKCESWVEERKDDHCQKCCWWRKWN